MNYIKKSIIGTFAISMFTLSTTQAAELFSDDFSDAIASAANWSTRVNGSTLSTFAFDGSDARLTEGNGGNADAMYRGFDLTTLAVGDSITLTGKAYMNVSQATDFRVGFGYSATGISDSIGNLAVDLQGYSMALASGTNEGGPQIYVNRDDTADINYFRNSSAIRGLAFTAGTQISADTATPTWSDFSFTLEHKPDGRIYFTGSVNGVALSDQNSGGTIVNYDGGVTQLTQFNYVGLSGNALGEGNYIVWDDIAVTAIPEPSAFALILSSLAAFVVVRRRKLRG
ncbi:PEP-CTERM sorting domain-containing protein [Opitutales bacterium]|nr:PEP-CTERM sorting domain-containing protein [Opitutales bacterium]